MTGSNRRNFIKTAGIGAAAVGAAAVVPATTGTAALGEKATIAPKLEVPAGASGSMVAYVHDVSKGEVSVMVEGREVTITDHQLVAKLAHAVHSPSSSV